MMPPWYEAAAIGGLTGTIGQVREAGRQIPASRREAVLLAFRRAVAQLAARHAAAPTDEDARALAVAEEVGAALDAEVGAAWWLALVSAAPELVPADGRLAVAQVIGPEGAERIALARAAAERSEEAAALAWMATLADRAEGQPTLGAGALARLLDPSLRREVARERHRAALRREAQRAT